MKRKLFEMKKSSFLEGTFIATLAIIITKVLGMLYVIPFCAMVGTQGSALYSYTYNVYIIFLEISSAGIPMAMSKIIKEYHTKGWIEAKIRTYKIGKKMVFKLSLIAFAIVFFFAPQIAFLILGNLEGGNTLKGVTFSIRCISLAILVIPSLSIKKGYLQGHNIINIPSMSQVLEQLVRIAIILIGSYLGLYVFNFSLEISVGLAVLGALLGGIVAILYLHKKIKEKRQDLFPESTKKDSVSDSTIKKTILSYALPFIMIDIATAVYNFVDMVFLSRTMTHLGYLASETEFITSSVSTWSNKIGMIVTSIAMGLIVSLSPSMVESFTLKKMEEVEKNFNKAIQMILIICIPMVLGISMLSRPIWNVFYGRNYLDLGSTVLRFSIFTALFVNLYMVTTSSLQSIQQNNQAYRFSIQGYLINAILDIPLMFFFHLIHKPPFLGAILSSLLGYSFSFFKSLSFLKKEYHLKYKKIMQTLWKVAFSSFIMLVGLSIFQSHVLYYEESKIITILYIGFMGLTGASIYFLTMYKLGALQEVFPFLDKKKLTLKKASSS